MKTYYSRLKRVVSSALVICLTATAMPTGIAYAAETKIDKPAVIYTAKNFDNQTVGELPYGFVLDDGIYSDLAEVVSAPTDENPDNKAANFKGREDNTAKRILFNMYNVPAASDFVLSMRFKLTDIDYQRTIRLIYGNTEVKNVTYLMGGSNYDVLKIDSGKIKLAEQEMYSNVKAGQWYKLELLFDLDGNEVHMYVNDEHCGSKQMAVNVKTVDGMRFIPASKSDKDWYVDDFRVYLSDEILTDEEFASDLAAYEESTLMPIERYETSKIYDYNEFVFNTLYGEFVMSVGGIRFWKDDKFYNLPSPITEEGGKFIVPMRAFAESFGAEVSWSPDGTLISYNGSTLRFVKGDVSYYVNGKPSKLYYPITVENGVSYVQLDVLTHFFGVKYERKGNLISFNGDIVCEYDWAPELTEMTKDGLFGLSEVVMNRIEKALSFKRPQPEEIIAAYNETKTDSGMPSLLFTDWDEVKARMETETAYKTGVEQVISLAESYMELEPVVYELYDGLRGKFPQQLLDRCRNLSFAYKITGEQKYKDRVWEEIEVVYETFPDFNPGHPLDPGNSIHGIMYAYNWLYDDWDKETELPKFETIIERNIEPMFDAIYCSATPFLYGIDGYASFISGLTNQPIVIQTGYLAAAVCLFERNPEKYADVISTLLVANESALYTFAPDGAWEEGGMYWTYTVNALPVYINIFETVFGTDFGLCDAPGIMKTAYFPISIFGATSAFKNGDDSGTSKTHSYQLFTAGRNGDYALAKFYKENSTAYDVVGLANYITDAEIDAAGVSTEGMMNDSIFEGFNQVTLRSGPERSDTVVLLHGGTNFDQHGHPDAGTFQFDMLGERFATLVSHEDYNLRQYGSYTAGGTSLDKNMQKQFYRDKGESKNLVIANYGSIYGDLEHLGKAEIVKHKFGEARSYAITNLTSNNSVYECALRGVLLDKVTGGILVEDDYQAEEVSDFWWFMTTDADIELSDDGKSAILTKNNKSVWASIINDCDEVFEVLESKPLSELYPAQYGDVLTPELQTEVEEKYKRLAIHNPSTERFNVSVEFMPLSGSETEPEVKIEYSPMARWSADDILDMGSVDSMMLDGVEINGFKPDKYNYNVNLMTEKSVIPEITVSASDEYEVEIINVQTLPGTGAVILRKDGVVVGKYNIVFTPLNYTTTFLNEKQIPVYDFWASSEPQPENMAINLFDGNKETKYATDEFGGSVTVDYGSVQKIAEVKMSFLNGAKRKEYFKIEYSEDGVNWNVTFDGENSGTTADYESYDMNGVSARYIRVSYYGNSQLSNWVSVTELCAFTE